MQATKKEEVLMLKIYRALYAEIGVDIDRLIEDGTTQKESWFNDYFLAHEKQEEIMESILKTERFPKWKKQVIRNSIWLGASPPSVDFYYKLTRTDGLTKQSSRVKWIEFDENGKFKESFTLPLVGRSLLMSPFNAGFTWQTTEVTEILEEGRDFVRFTTKNSEYKLKRIIKNE